MLLTKNTLPNIIAVAIIALSFLLDEPLRQPVLNVGLFALSGALTNWLAIHMLFERVPGLYGSGIVPLHFEEFKAAILDLVTRELFKKDNIERVFNSSEADQPQTLDLKPAIMQLDFDVAFDQLVDVIMKSSFGGMLGMLGGQAALDPLREPFKKRMREFVNDVVESPKFQTVVRGQLASMTSSDAFHEKISDVVRLRLDELTPEMVKDIVQRMIKEHLGWLVVWGGVFGGLIGLLAGLII